MINFEIIHNICRGHPLQKSIKEQKTVVGNAFKTYPEKEINDTVCSIRKKDEKDLYLNKKLSNTF